MIGELKDWKYTEKTHQRAATRRWLDNYWLTGIPHFIS